MTSLKSFNIGDRVRLWQSHREEKYNFKGYPYLVSGTEPNFHAWGFWLGHSVATSLFVGDRLAKDTADLRAAIGKRVVILSEELRVSDNGHFGLVGELLSIDATTQMASLKVIDPPMLGITTKNEAKIPKKGSVITEQIKHVTVLSVAEAPETAYVEVDD